MKKHQFVKVDCNCARRATNFRCKHCGVMEYCGAREIQALDSHRASCGSPDAPDIPPAEKFRAMMGGAIDCLAPDFETWERDRKDAAMALRRDAGVD